MTGWEEYSLITSIQYLLKIPSTYDLPSSSSFLFCTDILIYYTIYLLYHTFYSD
ncbi:hypothetical protein RchiOBHm_Chr1g0348131 [Rosa chinensis]|uniref:Uncharacterized protein n=1 Tax=Rosa chinensis TaxID=74649 RepID=A0A2P6SFG4_ROSCH|nr:hypothetical protein RchiOBHm_Chr1g0348131 [Rosa chinensis]